MICPTCGILVSGENAKVLDSRPGAKNSIRRRRRCLKCGAKWPTMELICEEGTSRLVGPQPEGTVRLDTPGAGNFFLMMDEKARFE